MKAIFGNWKTSLAGVAAAVMALVGRNPDEAKKVWTWFGALGMALLGILAQDAKKGDGK